MQKIGILFCLIILTIGLNGICLSQIIEGRTRSSDFLFESRLDLQELGIDPDNLQQVLDSLNSTDDHIRFNIYQYCKYAKVRDALPIFKTLFYRYPSKLSIYGNNSSRRTSDRLNILDAISEMDGDGFQQEFRIELDSLKNYLEQDAYYYVQFASFLMKKYQDDYGFNTLISFYTTRENRIKYGIHAQIQYLEPFYSVHRTEVINTLRFICREDPDCHTRFFALEELKKISDPGFESLAYDRSRNDTSSSTRNCSRLLLEEIGSPLYLISLIDALKIETENRRVYYNRLLNSRQLWTYKYVLDIFNNNTYPADQSFVQTELALYSFHLEPSSNIGPGILLDSLIASLQQIQSYKWIINDEFISELNGYLIAAKQKLVVNDSIQCARKLRSFQNQLDTHYNDSSANSDIHITQESWNYLHYSARYILERLPSILPDPILNFLVPPNTIINSPQFLFSVIGQNFTNGSSIYWNGLGKSTTFIIDTMLQCVILTTDISVLDSPLVTVINPDGGESNGIRFYIKQQPQISGCIVKLISSSNARLTTGTLQYYEGSWKDAVNNNDGTFTVNTTQKVVSLRMTYEYGTQTKSNVPIIGDTIAFQTVNAQIKLQNNLGNPIDTGTVQYYAGAWRNLGTTTNGVASKELLPGTYSFRMTYAYASKDQQQDIGANSTVIFQTVNTSVQLKNSLGNLIDQGTVQYYSGAWREFGTTINGTTNKELLADSYSFRMTYAYASKDKQQDLSVNPTVVFQTVNAQVRLQNSQGVVIDTGTVQYYSGAWRTFGSTVNGTATKELLPNNYSFRMTYAYASKDKQQDLNVDPTVVFQTVNAAVQLKNSQGNLMDQGVVQYYSGSWRSFDTTTNGTANKELLPNSYSFRMTNEYISIDKTQDLSINGTVSFSTVLCTVRVKNSQNQPVDNATASYYSGAWRQIGLTVNGEVTKKLLPANLTFRVKLGTVQQDKTQNLSTNNVVEFNFP